MRRTIFSFATLLCLFFTLGCSSTKVGNPINKKDILEITKNVTTKQEVLDIFGEPTRFGVHGSNEVISYIYRYESTWWNPLSIIPFVTVSDSYSEEQRLRLSMVNQIVIDYQYDEGKQDGNTKKVK